MERGCFNEKLVLWKEAVSMKTCFMEQAASGENEAASDLPAAGFHVHPAVGQKGNAFGFEQRSS